MIYMKNIMKEAHKLTREIVKEFQDVDYKAQLGICLSFLSKNKGDVEEMSIEEKLNNLGFKTWKKGEGENEKKRVYINSLTELLDALNVKCNSKAYRKDKMYYDVVADKFVYNVSRSAESTVKEAIKVLRA